MLNDILGGDLKSIHNKGTKGQMETLYMKTGKIYINKLWHEGVVEKVLQQAKYSAQAMCLFWLKLDS